MYGLGSNDFLYGRQGADTLQAGIDDDALYGYYGDDKLVGEKATTSSTRMTNRPPNGWTSSTAAQDGTRSISTKASTNSAEIVR
jgi:Ca2+-binding RTX toxin-like protein